MENIRISAGLRPAFAANSRMPATRGAITFADGPDMKTHSACSAANGRALWRRLAQMNGVETVVLALVLDAVNFRRIGEDAASAIAHRRIILPASFPQLVDDLHIFIGNVVAVIMRRLLVFTGGFGGAV